MDPIYLSLMLGFIWYQIIAHVGISGGIHRYFAHKQFQIPSWFENVILYMCVIAGARSPIGWIAAHRMHHAYSDTELDPHSPKFKGFWTVFLSQWTIEYIPPKFSKDLLKNPRLRFFHFSWLKVWIISAIISYLVNPYFFIGFILVPAVLSFIGFGCVNALCHVYGDSRDFPWANILTAGEGYHLQHHINGGKYRLHKYDSTGFLIEKLLKFGIITRHEINKKATSTIP